VQVSSIFLARRPRRSERVMSCEWDLEAGPNWPSLAPFEQRITSPPTVGNDLQNAGLHSGKHVIADKDEAAGSSPARPTTLALS
jgi:hypothetical protein